MVRFANDKLIHFRVRDLYKGQTVFVLGGSPTLLKQNYKRLETPGVISIGINNTPTVVHTTMAMFGDVPECYDQRLLHDPTIIKFARYGAHDRLLEDGSKWKDMPNTVFFEHKPLDKWDDVPYPASQDDNVEIVHSHYNTLEMVLSTLMTMGVQRIVLAGCSFDTGYSYGANLTDGQAKSNARLYSQQVGMLKRIKPDLDERGISLVDCSVNSKLADTYDTQSLDAEIDRVLGSMPERSSEDSLLYCTDANVMRFNKKSEEPPVKKRSSKVIRLFYILDLSMEYRSAFGTDPFEMLMVSVCSFAMYLYDGFSLEVCVVRRGWDVFHTKAITSMARMMGFKLILKDADDVIDEIGSKTLRDVCSLKPVNDGMWTNYSFLKLAFWNVFSGEDVDYVVILDNDVFCNGRSFSVVLDEVSRLSSCNEFLFAGTLDPWCDRIDGFSEDKTGSSGWYINTGFLIVNTSVFKSRGVFEKYLDILERDILKRSGEPRYNYPFSANMGHDQSVINSMAYENGLVRMILPVEYAYTFEGRGSNVFFKSYSSRIKTDVEPGEFSRMLDKSCVVHLVDKKSRYKDHELAYAGSIHPALSYVSCVFRLVYAEMDVNVMPGTACLDIPGTARSESVSVNDDSVVCFTAVDSEKWLYDFTMPSIMSLFATSGKNVSKLYVLATGSVLNSKLESMIRRLSSMYGHSCRFRPVNCDNIDMSAFSKANMWGGHPTRWAQMAYDLVPEDRFVMFFDGDVLFVNDVSPLFSACNHIGRDCVLARSRKNLGEASDIQRYESRYFLAGGLFLLNPSSDAAKSLSRSIWFRDWHSNDDYSTGLIRRPGEIIDTSGSMAWTTDKSFDETYLTCVHICHDYSFGRERLDPYVSDIWLQKYIHMFNSYRSIVSEMRKWKS